MHVACRLVAELQNENSCSTVVGWAALSSVSQRAVYRGVAEVSVYISAEYAGQGIGTRLLSSLVIESEKAGFWTLQSSIFPGNKASEKLHLACGFRILGVRENIARLDGEWRDTVILERRSRVVGVA